MNDKPGSMLLHAYACGRIGVGSKTGSAGFAAFGASVGVAGLPDISTISAIVVRGNCRVVVCMDRRVVAASVEVPSLLISQPGSEQRRQ